MILIKAGSKGMEKRLDVGMLPLSKSTRGWIQTQEGISLQT